MKDKKYTLTEAEFLLEKANVARAKAGVKAAADRLSMFSEVVDMLDSSIREVRRLHTAQSASLAQAMEQMKIFIKDNLDATISKHTSLVTALEEFKQAFALRKGQGKDWKWYYKGTEDEFHDACEKLFLAYLEQTKN